MKQVIQVYHRFGFKIQHLHGKGNWKTHQDYEGTSMGNWKSTALIVGMVYNMTFWLNCFPHKDGVYNVISPRTILTGLQIDHNKHW